MTKLLNVVLGFLGQCLVKAVLMSICVAVLFAIFGVVVWFFTNDADLLLSVPLFGAIVGALLGVGQVVQDSFGESKPKPESDSHEAGLGKEIAMSVAERVVPPLEQVFLIGKVLHWLTATDFKAQKPGRWKRAFLGAVVLGVIMFGVVIAVIWTVTQRSFSEMIWAVPFAAAIGALLGAVSDSL